MAKSAANKGLAGKLGTGTALTALAALTLPIWLLALTGWAIMLAGLAAVQSATSNLGHYLQFDWFVLAFMFLALMLLPFHVLIRRSSPGVIAFLAVATVLTILRTNVWNDARLANRGFLQQNISANYIRVDSVTNPGLQASKARTDLLFAGYLITSAFALLTILAIGNLPASSAQDAEFLEKKGRQAAEEHGNGNSIHPDHKTGQGNRDNFPSGPEPTSAGSNGQPGMVSWAPANGPPGGHVPVADRV